MRASFVWSGGLAKFAVTPGGAGTAPGPSSLPDIAVFDYELSKSVELIDKTDLRRTRVRKKRPVAVSTSSRKWDLQKDSCPKWHTIAYVNKRNIWNDGRMALLSIKAGEEAT